MPRTWYAMATTYDGLQQALADRSGTPSLDLTACTLTDLQGAVFDGLSPALGEPPARGVIRAYTPSQSTILPRKAQISVWVAAFDPDAPNVEAKP